MKTKLMSELELSLTAQASNQKSSTPATGLSRKAVAGKKIWIDIDNSPHVPFFLPIIKKLEGLGVEVILTARDVYQVCELLQFFHLPCKVIGGHYGKHKALKVLGNCWRAGQLWPVAIKARPDLALSHGSRAQVLACKTLGVATIMMHDYEHSTKTGFVEPSWILMPDVIPNNAMSTHAGRILKYPGLKEDVYIPSFTPDPSILTRFGISPDSLLVTLRPPATEAHYHNPEGEALFAETLRMLSDQPQVRGIALPRNAKQGAELRKQWADQIARGSLIIPETPVDGLNLIWFSDLVVSGGGTMNREAAALGVPVYSVFRGKIGAVDKYLADNGRLTLLGSVNDVRTKIHLVRWNRPAKPENTNRPALMSIVDSITTILEGKCPTRSRLA